MPACLRSPSGVVVAPPCWGGAGPLVSSCCRFSPRMTSRRSRYLHFWELSHDGGGPVRLTNCCISYRLSDVSHPSRCSRGYRRASAACHSGHRDDRRSLAPASPAPRNSLSSMAGKRLHSRPTSTADYAPRLAVSSAPRARCLLTRGVAAVRWRTSGRPGCRCGGRGRTLRTVRRRLPPGRAEH